MSAFGRQMPVTRAWRVPEKLEMAFTSGGHGPQHAELLRLIGTLVGLRSDA